MIIVCCVQGYQLTNLIFDYESKKILHRSVWRILYDAILFCILIKFIIIQDYNIIHISTVN